MSEATEATLAALQGEAAARQMREVSGPEGGFEPHPVPLRRVLNRGVRPTPAGEVTVAVEPVIEVGHGI